jgi:proteasome lid subunit RPN8/RPN11
MTSKQSQPLRRIAIRRQTIHEMLEQMRKFGKVGCELLVLWVGDVDSANAQAEVRQAFVPKQKPIKSEEGVGYFVESETLFQLNKDLAQTGLRLIAQVHSHPQEAFHSEADDRYAIMTAQGGLSLVVPNFGNAPPDPSCWAVYRLNGRDWNEVSEDDVKSLFVLKDG